MTRTDLDLLRFSRDRLLARLDGLTDAEYLWEPVADCWTVRRRADGTWAGDVAADGTHFSRSDPPPFTTIAWRLWHLGASPLPTWPQGDASAHGFVDAYFHQIKAGASPAVGTADEAVALVAATWEDLLSTLGRFSDDELDEAMGPTAGFFADATLEGLVLHIADELIHHGAEIGVLRDLYAHR